MYHCTLPKELLAVILVACLITLTLPGIAGATAPKDIKLEYTQTTSVLKVTIDHMTLAKTMHYIKNVIIKNNGVEVGSYMYNFQPEREIFTYTYSVPANPGDTLEVKAVCNLWGSKAVSLQVGK